MFVNCIKYCSVIIGTLLLVSGCKSTPDFPISNEFDGRWHGKRTDISNASICLPTTITGTIKKGNVTFKQTYNQSYLTGWVSSDGNLVLNPSNTNWPYKFTGKANNNKITGTWNVSGAAPCNGTWYVNRIDEYKKAPTAK